MSRFIEDQSLAKELEGFSSTISRHFSNDAYFSRMLADYDALHQQIVVMEQDGIFEQVRQLESLKVERDALRVNLIDMLKKAS